MKSSGRRYFGFDLKVCWYLDLCGRERPAHQNELATQRLERRALADAALWWRRCHQKNVSFKWAFITKGDEFFESHAQAERHIRKILVEDGFRAIGRAYDDDIWLSGKFRCSEYASLGARLFASRHDRDPAMKLLHQIASAKGWGSMLVRIVSGMRKR